MNQQLLERIISEDYQGLLETKTKAKWRIYGRINGKRGGTFQGFDDYDTPIFGGSNLIYAPIWWNKTWEEVEEICQKIISIYPNCQATPDKCN